MKTTVIMIMRTMATMIVFNVYEKDNSQSKWFILILTNTKDYLTLFPCPDIN